MKGARKGLHFFLTEDEATAVIDAVNGLAGLRRDSPLATVADKLDEQIAQQFRQYEICPSCGGDGWKEGE